MPSRLTPPKVGSRPATASTNAFVEFEVEHVDVAEAEDGAAVGDDGDEVAPGGALERVASVGVDGATGAGDARRVRQAQVALGVRGPDRPDLDLPRRSLP